MIESSLDSMVAISPEVRITDVNEAAVKVTGITIRPFLVQLKAPKSDSFWRNEQVWAPSAKGLWGTDIQALGAGARACLSSLAIAGVGGTV